MDTAWRYWLHSTLDGALLAEAQQGAKTKAAEANQRNAATLELRLSELANMSPSDKVLRWPSLYAQAERRDSAGKAHFENGSVTLIVDAFPANWSFRDGLWWSTTTVNKIQIDVVAVMAEQENWLQLVQPMLKKPTLVVFLPVLREIGEYYIDHFNWLGTEKWQVKLENQVKSALQCKLDEAERLNSNIDSFVHRFIGMDNEQRLSFLHIKFEIPPPTTPGWHDRAWNAPAGLWKRLVWQYCVKSAKGSVSTEWIATSDWLKRLLEFSEDDAALQKRRKAAWFFLKKLEKRGWICHTMSQNFVLLTSLKNRGWQPWMDER